MSPLRRFFDTFGYVVLRNVYDKNLVDELRDIYDKVCATHFGETTEAFLADPKALLCGVEQSQELLFFFQNSRILPVVDELFGEDAIFLGSDLSTFKSSSQFHRDVWGDYNLFKAGIYLQETSASDGGQFCCIPGSHIYGDRFSGACTQGLQWPYGAGYAPQTFIGDFDFNDGAAENSIPTTKIDLAVGDIIFFNQSLVHSVPASNRLRRMIALTFMEGATAYNSRVRVPGEFSDLTHTETVIAYRLSSFLTAVGLGRIPELSYPEGMSEFNIDRLRKYLVTFSGEEFSDVKDRVLKSSYDVAYRFITRINPKQSAHP